MFDNRWSDEREPCIQRSHEILPGMLRGRDCLTDCIRVGQTAHTGQLGYLRAQLGLETRELGHDEGVGRGERVPETVQSSVGHGDAGVQRGGLCVHRLSPVRDLARVLPPHRINASRQFRVHVVSAIHEKLVHHRFLFLHE